MSHFELLAKVPNYTSHINLEATEKRNRALCSVIELHKPIIYGQTQLRCSVCIWSDGYDSEPESYPCPTIQAIKRELE